MFFVTQRKLVQGPSVPELERGLQLMSRITALRVLIAQMHQAAVHLSTDNCRTTVHVTIHDQTVCDARIAERAAAAAANSDDFRAGLSHVAVIDPIGYRYSPEAPAQRPHTDCTYRWEITLTESGALRMLQILLQEKEADLRSLQLELAQLTASYSSEILHNGDHTANP
ncbi:MAG: hypothetical protein EOP50_00230 [Sphingobacteriales bacterium]|nr:MAG: hypothetical protein EOP50_00230 [Sphingobacteriales bacterium]